MTDRQQAHSSWTAVVAFAVFAGALAGGLALLEKATRPSIASNQAAYSLQMIAAVLPKLGYDNDPGMDVIPVRATALVGNAATAPAYRARTDGRFTAIAMTVVATDGYVGPIKLLVGIDEGGRIIRVRAVEHRETPGLGDKIDISRSDWISLFDGKAADPQTDWLLSRDGGTLDHITGATITSRAVTRAVRTALDYYLENAAALQAVD